ncbi:MAG: 50S ribosomal protein L10 [Candidatus Nanoarchaeia archaeon]|nr:50S ribosomal protein L10 [Candidatus Nanoarchaeia archaeon]MDD5740855.1 50S ribosomal protein L10 [Candidatus Nanoarchaeia archaeon]
MVSKANKSEKTTVRESHQIKEKTVKKLAEKIQNAQTFMIISIKSLPSPQFQSIKKEIRKQADIQVAKKNILIRAIEELKKESILPMENHVQDNCAFAISNLDGFELARLLAKNKNPVFARAGQIANAEIEVKAGPTSLAPGPAISELGALGIQISVEDGKINIRQPRVIVRNGEKITTAVASLLQKLDIKPFTIGLEPVAVYDVKDEKIYTNIKIDSEETTNNLKIAAGKSLGFAQKIVYYCRETIGYLLAKANNQGSSLNKLQPTQNVQTKSEEVK